MQDDITQAKRFGRAMGRIHSEMHKIVSDNLPSKKNRYETEILESRDTLKDIITDIKEEYLNSYFQNSESTLEKIEKWRPIVAVARIKEKIPGELNWLLFMINI